MHDREGKDDVLFYFTLTTVAHKQKDFCYQKVNMSYFPKLIFYLGFFQTRCTWVYEHKLLLNSSKLCICLSKHLGTWGIGAKTARSFGRSRCDLLLHVGHCVSTDEKIFQPKTWVDSRVVKMPRRNPVGSGQQFVDHAIPSRVDMSRREPAETSLISQRLTSNMVPGRAWSLPTYMRIAGEKTPTAKI